MKKNKEIFEQELGEVYSLSIERNDNINSYLKAIEEDCFERREVDNFLNHCKIPISNESRFAVVLRITSLKDSSLVEHVKSLEFPDSEIVRIKFLAHLYAKQVHMKSFEWFIEEVNKRNLLTPFYRALFFGVHRVGQSMNRFHVMWNSHIINKINPSLEKRFADQESIMKYLRKNNLLDNGHEGIEADRCYSALVENRGKYFSKSYYEAFPKSCRNIISDIKKMIFEIQGLEDNVYGQKEEWIKYFNSLILAFSETNVNELVFRWADVDRAWMKITVPIQVVHPTEYYEDHYRKAVAVEWDLRIQNLNLPENKHYKLMMEMFLGKFSNYPKNSYDSVYKESINNLENTQLYIGGPVLYYGSFFDGLFSAQIIPNDTVVSSELGKKIFAFPDRILKSLRESPFTKFPNEIFEEGFLTESRKFIYNNAEDFHRIYIIDTIGHEYGHALWINKTSEVEMNKSGNFKNIEEFKATAGGMMAFFENEEEDLKRVWLRELVLRTINLMTRKEIQDMRPYYFEGIIHLTGLIEAGVVRFSGEKIIVDLSLEKYEAIKSWYIKVYEELILHYLQKRDALEFLNLYIMEIEEDFLPIESIASELVIWIYEKYQEFGNVLDTSVKKEDYIIRA